SDGRVAIGTTAASSRLTVRGTNLGACGPALMAWGGPITRGCGSALAITTDAPSGSLLIEGLNPSGRVFVVTGTGAVGINTSDPQRLLDVAGRARIGSIPSEPSTGQVCFNVAGDLLQCGASSLKWKTNVAPFR